MVVINMYIALGQGQTTPWIFFFINIYSINLVLCCKFPPIQ